MDIEQNTPSSLQFRHTVRLVAGWLLGLAALIFMLLCGYYLRWELGQPFEIPYPGLYAMAAGIILLGAAIFLLRSDFGLFKVSREKTTVFKVSWPMVGLGVIALAVFAEANGQLIFPDFWLSEHIQVLLFVAGIAGVGLGLCGFGFMSILRGLLNWTRSAWRFVRHFPVLRPGTNSEKLQTPTDSLLAIIQSARDLPHYVFDRPLLVLAIITLIAFILRAWDISGALHYMIDELHFVDGLQHLEFSNTYRVVYPLDGYAPSSHLFSYLQLLSSIFFGVSFTAWRMPAAVVGTLAIPAVYLLGEGLFDKKTGLITAAMLATFPPHIHFSRLAMDPIVDSLSGTLVFAFLVRGLRKNSQRDYVLAGLSLGLTAYFYEAGRLLFLAVLIGWLGFILVFYRPWRHRRGLLLMALAALLVAMPFYYTRSRPEFAGFAPNLTREGAMQYLIRDLKVKPLFDVLQQHYNDALKATLFHTIYSPDGSRFYYGGASGIVIWYLIPFYMLGFAFALWGLRHVGVLLLLWLLGAIAGISLVMGTDWTVRFCVMFPVMALLIAIGLRYIFEMLWLPAWPRRLLYVMLTIIVIAYGVVQVNYYFGEHLPLYNAQRNQLDYNDAFERVVSYDPKARLYYLSRDGVFDPQINTYIYLAHVGLTYERWPLVEVTRARLESLPRDRQIILAIESTDANTLTIVQTVFNLKMLPWSPYPSIPMKIQYALYVATPLG